jgi:opacity protein-like surface antigen
MANAVIGIPVGGQTGGGVRPYVSGGVGIMKSRIGDAGDLFAVDSTDWGFNVGGGVTGFMTDNFGLRGDVRYFRSFEDFETPEPDDDFNVGIGDFRFWRGTLGFVFRF